MIQLTQVSKRFQRAPVLDNISLTIDTGERIALVGSNGAGKTTLIRCLLGEYRHDGTILINGRSPVADREDLLRETGFVPQLPPALKMPVGQLLRFASDLCGTDVARMEGVAQRLGLDARAVAAQPFNKLSGGQKQKLLISIALGRETHLLIMDEPAANLDPDARQTFFQLLAERPSDTTMLISSHRLDEVAALVNRVLELDRGKVALDDRVHDEVSLTSLYACRLRLQRAEEAIGRALTAWGFREQDGEWRGTVPGPDRLRFMGLLSRYVGVIASASLEEMERESP